MWEKQLFRWPVSMSDELWRIIWWGGGLWQMHLRENNIDCLRCLISTWIKETTEFSLYWLRHKYLTLKKSRWSETAAFSPPIPSLTHHKSVWTTSPVPLWSDWGGYLSPNCSRGSFQAVTRSAGGALPPSDTDLLDNFTAVSSVMGQDKWPAPQWLSWLLGRTGLSRTGTVCFIACVQCVFARGPCSIMSFCYNYFLYLLHPPCLATIPWRPFSLFHRPLNLPRLHYATHPLYFHPFSSIPPLLSLCWCVRPVL